MTAAEWGQLVVKAILVGLLLYGYFRLVCWIGYKLHELDQRYQETERLRQLLILAEAYEVAPTEKDRSDIYKKAESLGFTEDAFALDDVEQPHPPRAA